ncbi:MAG: hypothetical protein Unbinned5930contig1000_1, partial [Prokaryotic dsDNA virus sp.]
QKIACNLGSYSHKPRECGSPEGEPCDATYTATAYLHSKWTLDFDVTGSAMSSINIMIGSGCESYGLIGEYSSFTLLTYCNAPAAQDLYVEKEEKSKK